jgi:hypothetical protein
VARHADRGCVHQPARGRAEIVSLYSEPELEAEIPEAVARVEAGLHPADPRRRSLAALTAAPTIESRRAALRKAVQVGYAAVDRQPARVRSFRNIIRVCAAVLTIFLSVFVTVVASHPRVVPMCFRPDPAKDF